MGRRHFVAVGMFLSLFGTGTVSAFPQSSEKRDQKAEAEKSRDMQQQPKIQNNGKNEDEQTSVALPPSAKGLGERFLLDQKQIWTSPGQLRWTDANWLVPLSGITAAFFVTDADMSRHISHNPTTVSHYDTVSNATIGALLGGAGAMWFFSFPKHEPHWRETGFLAGEAVINSLVVTEAMKYPLGRQRPYQGDGNGEFFKGGVSFPSEHATAAWAAAGVVAHEYPGPLTKILVYSMATLVDYSRYRARQHFPSDVLVGSVIGNLVAQNVYSRHHDPELGGEAWRSISAVTRDLANSRPSNPASPYVPLGSWIYPAIERLAAQGFIDITFLGSRPWTRIECTRLVQEAGDKLADMQSTRSEPERLYEALYSEFRHDFEALANGGENVAKLESLYTTSTEIVGQPLNDSYHFGQTIIDNNGRPYQQGFNTYDGFSGWAAEGRYAIYVRGEYQHAPSAPGFSQQIENLIGQLDENPARTASRIPATNQFRLLDTYVATALGGWNLTFGKQSLWWGQGEGGALLFSDNAEPMYMFRASRIVPFSLPWIFRYLGPMKVDAFMGQLAGNAYPARPLLHGEKVSFKPTKNVEIAFTRLAEMGGAPVPGITPAPPVPPNGCPFGNGRTLTPGAFLNSYFSPHESNYYGCSDNPGKRTAGFEFSYRVPFLRDWVTLYTDSLSSDDISPISAPRRAAINPGVYVSHFPKLSKLDLRIEGVYTDTPSSSFNGEFIYFDNFYHDLSTNKGNIIGSWIGRQGQGMQAWTTYWFSPRSTLQFGYRNGKVSPNFIPGGETVNDAFTKANWWVRNNLEFSISVQYEKWLAPVLNPNPQTNWTSSVGISFQPRGFSLPFRSNREDRGQGAAPATKDAQQ